jgi:hypothetical protein
MATRKKAVRVSAAKRFGQIEQISIAGITERIAPLAFHVYAESFLIAARSLPPATVRFDPARPYLICHSIELGLKAFLSLQGATMLGLADAAFGHNLEVILQKADEKGLAASVSLTATQRSAIRLSATYYSGKVFEYPAVGEALSAYPSMPALETLLEAAGALVHSLRQLCLAAK